MTNQEVMVVYNWTAKSDKSEALKAIYQEVTQQMKDTEPDAQRVACYFDDNQNKLVVYDLFKDSAALAQHLGTTAANHFSSLMEIAVPGPFLFCGNVPEELQKAAIGMGLNATFAPKVFGFDRSTN